MVQGRIVNHGYKRRAFPECFNSSFLYRGFCHLNIAFVTDSVTISSQLSEHRQLIIFLLSAPVQSVTASE